MDSFFWNTERNMHIQCMARADKCNVNVRKYILKASLCNKRLDLTRLLSHHASVSEDNVHCIAYIVHNYYKNLNYNVLLHSQSHNDIFISFIVNVEETHFIWLFCYNYVCYCYWYWYYYYFSTMVCHRICLKTFLLCLSMHIPIPN